MLGGSALTGRGVLPAVARQRFSALSRSTRSMSSFRPQVSRTAGRSGLLNQTLTGARSWRPAPAVLGVSAARFNSTGVTPETTASWANTQPEDLGVLSFLDISSIPEKIGYLKEVGLDFGWGPSAVIEFFVEHFHIWGGLPWWGSIVATGILLRIALVKPMMGAVDTSTRMNNIKPLMDPLRAKMTLYQSQGKLNELAVVREEMTQLQKTHGVNPWKSFVPMLQIPFGFGCYRVVKAMAVLPVPGLAAESVGWITDLTVADPFFILPLLTSYFMFLSFKRGGEQGNNPMNSKTTFGSAVLYGLPAISFAFMAFFPSALQLYFVSTGLFGLLQAYLVHSPAFRSWAKIAQNQPIEVDASKQAEAIRMLTDQMEAERARLQEQQTTQSRLQLSLIDRFLNNAKTAKTNLVKETTEKINEIRGAGPAKNADGSFAEPPRLSEKDRKLADDYEKRRREEEEWKREERNHSRRRAHQQAMEQQREKARSAFKPPRKE
ncbi:hypothetical protein BO70DRAFT_316248 [Aspergillus heteromorphus CBS 117.55]|uniref:Membrane insertase YidC/Oxa/ALB C-terminal domain-containing protein n=1 Tax=Aspergillus heteromorphus CBS 117.55 TaxID=1448321 RepID=A0A317W145_9EURO|nr:uncharacterized protein BO70DRAFT_316248 [Aspergillus heteromorphus CBS 117.55]PWY79609.1 hypothetical protein BO70DRAFT_316248 [Aspergillus heteromorphus CBS 117.55]